MLCSIPCSMDWDVNERAFTRKTRQKKCTNTKSVHSLRNTKQSKSTISWQFSHVSYLSAGGRDLPVYPQMSSPHNHHLQEWSPLQFGEIFANYQYPSAYCEGSSSWVFNVTVCLSFWRSSCPHSGLGITRRYNTDICLSRAVLWYRVVPPLRWLYQQDLVPCLPRIQ